jgi:hypothetical protein
MKKVILAGILVILTFCVTLNAWSAFRCKNVFVKEGADSAKIFLSCGEPVYKENLPYMDSYVQKWVYGPYSGYYYIVYIESGKCIKVEEKSQNSM